MDYEQFYKDVSQWIQECNNAAAKYGMHSSDFWRWTTNSIGELSEKYGNNALVIRQMIMLFDWLQDIK